MEWLCKTCQDERNNTTTPSFALPNGESTRLSAAARDSLLEGGDLPSIANSVVTAAGSFTVGVPISNPQVIEEPSINDPPVVLQQSAENGETDFVIVAAASKKGKDLLVEKSGYSYNVSRRYDKL